MAGTEDKTPDTEAPKAPVPEEVGKVPAPSIGYGNEGRSLVIEIDLRWGSTFILGFLSHTATDWFKSQLVRQQIEREKSLIKPEKRQLKRYSSLFEVK